MTSLGGTNVNKMASHTLLHVYDFFFYFLFFQVICNVSHYSKSYCSP